ncbi:hypothetical protein [Salinispora oceanensis]|nr:hypothetical protein [Salinispora oceanensis]
MPEIASPPLSLPELQAIADAGGQVKYLFFWGINLNQTAASARDA